MGEDYLSRLLKNNGGLTPVDTSGYTFTPQGAISTDANGGINFDWLNKANLGLAGQGLGLVGGLANMYSNLWGQNADLMDTQIGMLKDQRNYNKELMANKREFNKNLGEGLAGAFA